MELLLFNAEAFCRLSGIVGQTVIYLRHNAQLSDETWSVVGGSLGELQREAEKMNLRMVSTHIRNYRLRLKQAEVTNESLNTFLTELQSRLVDELGQRIFLAVPTDRRDFYEKNPFPDSVTSAFPSAVGDMIEAGKCFALSRYTACVMHLARVVEAGLRVLTDDIGGVKLKHDWGGQLGEIDKELARRYKATGARSPDELFYSGAATQIGHMKNAWRNPAMHVEKRYGEEMAEDILNAVRAFMRHLATRLKEQP